LPGPRTRYKRELDAQNYIDLHASWMATKWLTLRAGINNVFDSDPPPDRPAGPSVFGNNNTFPGTYEARAAKFFFNATL
jgi:outer membrane receptor protein involved in Fe transport